MKKKLLPLAILAGLAGTAQAAVINTDGLGETLIYPFYSVEGGQDTYITVVNTTNSTKAVKVRVIEAMNSAEVLDFNLYLSPEDHWSATITATEAGAKLKTSDKSCTVPTIPAAGVDFRNHVYNGDGGGNSLERTREGYVEIIEMGVIDDSVAGGFNAAAAALHTSEGVPKDCKKLTDAWIGQGKWAVDPSANFNTAVDAGLLGGLYGYGVLINVNEGTNATYSAVAMDAFFATTPQHTNSGFTTPSLGEAGAYADIFNSATGTIESLDFADGWDAVSALIQHDTISNDYIMAPSIAAGTDWVITMPTKRNYVYGLLKNNPADPTGPQIPATEANAPFLNVWKNGKACEEVQIENWDREEQTTSVPVGDVDFSPRPPAAEVKGFALCSEVNVISFLNPDAVVNEDDEGNVTSIDGYVSAVHPSARIQYGFKTVANNGWARVSFAQDNSGNARELEADTGEILKGLPAVGFAVQKYSNTSVEGVGDTGAFYSGLIEHKYTRDIQ